MELLVSQIEHRQYFVNESGDFKDACEWDKVLCDKNDNIIEIDWNKLRYTISFNGGKVQLEWLPPRTTDFIIVYQHLEGILQIELLPQFLKRIRCGDNNLSGTLNLKKLPPQIEIFSFYRNNLQGPLDLSNLPSHN